MSFRAFVFLAQVPQKKLSKRIQALTMSTTVTPLILFIFFFIIVVFIDVQIAQNRLKRLFELEPLLRYYNDELLELPLPSLLSLDLLL